MIIQLPWEKNTNGTHAFLKKRPVKKVLPSLSKLIALLKMTDVTLVSGIFNETEIAFEENISVFVESSTCMGFFGAYSRAFTNEEDEFPYLCLRKGFWDKANELRCSNKKNQKEYIYGSSQIISVMVFLNPVEAREFVNLISEMMNMMKNGIKFKELQETEPSETEQEFVEYSITDGYLNHDFSYNPYNFKCDELENWTVRWREAFKTVDQNAGRIPEQGSQISYKASRVSSSNLV
ncbi:MULTISPECIES: hypothetical protein [unclassified Microcoleus]|uniref:hypothetical protein n=1 Tax=unclassified Microcoleus TaxID=2642155 RepID=UPI002FD46C9F